MSAFDFLTEYDKELIERYIRNFGPTLSDRFEHWKMKSLDVILKEWDKNKSGDLLKLFGGEDLIISRPYSYLAQAEAISQKINEARNEPAPRAFMRWYDTMIHTAGNNIETFDMQGNNVRDKINWWYSPWYAINECMTDMALAANAYLGDDYVIKFPKSGKTMKLFRGMKPMKVLHRIVQEFDGDEQIFEAYRTWHSMQLNQKRMDGELCLSIHPMDFITMSDNANGWKSCMRWTDGEGHGDDDHGDFRSGTVQCMNSPYIIVAYLHNPEHKFYPFNCINDTTTWNSKQWRELFIVQDGVINEIKGYPFQDENLTNACLMWIKELAKKNLSWEYENEEVDVGREIPTEDPQKQILLTYDSGSFMYKDIGAIQKHRGRINKDKLLNGKYYIQESINPKNDNISYFITVEYGGEGTCMSCGVTLPFERSERVMCDYCDSVQICSCCGDPIYDESEMYWIDDRDGPICEGCWCDECTRDNFNEDETHLTSNMTEIWLLLGYDFENKPVFHDNIAYTFEPEYSCSNFRDVFPNGYNTMQYKDGWFSSTRHYVTIGDITENCERDACMAFDIYPYDINRFYANAIADNDLVYDYNHELICPDEEEDEK